MSIHHGIVSLPSQLVPRVIKNGTGNVSLNIHSSVVSLGQFFGGSVRDKTLGNAT